MPQARSSELDARQPGRRVAALLVALENSKSKGGVLAGAIGRE